MTRGRPHGRSKSDHRVSQAARYARAAEYRERIGISAEQLEARIAAVNAECEVQDAPCRRWSQKLRGRTNEARAARRSAWSRSCKGPGTKKKRANMKSLGKHAGRDPHTLHCHHCGATAEFGLRGGKGWGKVKFFCRGHVHSHGCFRIDRDCAVWTEEQELRRLKAELARLEKELQQLRDTSSAREPASDEPGCSSFAPAAWTSTPMSRSLIATLLIIGGIESNPGPTPNEIARKSWVEADPDIETLLLDYLAEQKLNVSNWRKLSPEDRSGFLTKLEAGYQGEWALGWSVFLKAVAAAGTSALDETSGGTQLMGVPAAAGEVSGVLTLDQFQAGLQPIQEGLQGLLEELRKTKERKPKSFSRVGSTEAQNLLAELEFAEEVGNLEDPILPPPDVPVADGFDYSRYPSEDTGTPALLQHHKQQLQKYGVSFGRGSFEMYDIHDNKKLFSFVAPNETAFTGTADGLLAPFGLYPESAARQCRALFEHKQTEEQKQSYRDNNPNLAGGSGKDAGPPGPVQYKAHKGQALVCYLASLKTSSFPLIYDLCDGETHNLLHLRDGFIKVWEGLSPTQAYWKLAQLLLHMIPAANDKRLSLDAIPEEFQVPLKKLKGLEPSSLILEQLESVLPFVHESERFACTQELLAPWFHSFKVPESIRHMYN